MWVIDNASSDGTPAYLQSLKEPFYWRSAPDKGVYDAMNKGITLARGEWLYFLGADDMLFDTTILANIFSKPIATDIKMIIGKIKYNIKKNDVVYTNNKNGIVSSSWSKKLWIKNSLHHQGVFYKKELFLQRNFSLQYKILADYALNLQLYKMKVKVKAVDNIIALCSTGGLSKNYNWALYKEEIKLKTTESSIVLKPLFMMIGYTKYLLKKTVL